MNNNRLIIWSIVIAIFVLMNQVIDVDNLFYNMLMKIKTDEMDNYFKIVTHLANPSTLIFLAALAFILFFIKKKKTGFYLVGILIISTIINQALKYIIMRPRPIGINLITQTGYSFPSGHAMGGTTFYGFIIFLIANSNLNKKLKYLINGLLIFLIFNICISRVYLGVHYFTDVLAGALISLCLIINASYIIKKYEKDVF